MNIRGDTSRVCRLRVAGFDVVSLGRQDFAGQMVADWGLQKRSGYLRAPLLSFSLNGQVIARAHSTSDLFSLVSSADYLDADGMWLVFASRLFHKNPLPERVATTDFFHDCASAAETNGMSFFLLGGTEDNNREVVEKLRDIYPALRVAGRQSGYFDLKDWEEVIAAIQSSKPDVVWVGMGFPRQERLAADLAGKLVGVTWVKTCGGLYEHILGRHPRAPRWMQRLGLEWLHRAIQEPGRLGWRYITTNPVALWHLLTKTRRR